MGGLNELVALAEEAGQEITVEEFDGLVYEEGEMLPRMGIGVTIGRCWGCTRRKYSASSRALGRIVKVAS